jgi:hypothetical protein
VIRKVVLRRFKKFKEVTFTLPGHLVIAGPNNTGKTTLLQAIAAWDLAFSRWKELGMFHRRGGSYPWAPIARQAFSAVPLRQFDLLWNEKSTGRSIEIEIQHTQGWSVTMEIKHDSTEQVKVRPLANVEPIVLSFFFVEPTTIFVPPMTGLATEEPLYARPQFLNTMIGQARPGEVLRNLLVEANHAEGSWRFLADSIRRLFNYELLPPDDSGAYIIAEYQMVQGGPRFDIASAGSGFQQVLMLLTFLATRPGATLLLDEPDAHLHVILQDAIYGELRAVAAAKGSQLIIATHSEVIIDSVDPGELCVLFQTPRLLATNAERSRLIKSLGILTNVEVMLAESAPGILYLEDHTDLEILRAWAKALDHPALPLLTTSLFWHKSVGDARRGGHGVSSRDHYECLKLVRENLPGLEILDRDGNSNLPETEIIGSGLQRLRWRRYEIESYLIHPESLKRFVELQLGPGAHSESGIQDMLAYMERLLQADFLRDPMNPIPLVENFLAGKKARTEILPPILDAAGLIAFPYTRYHEIAEVMRPEEIHPEVREKLDAICGAFLE